MIRLRLAALAGLAALAAAGLRATEARDMGFGAASAFIVSDSSYPSLPQVVDASKGAAYLELGAAPAVASATAGGTNSDTGAWGGADIPFGSGALGVWLGRPDTDFAWLYANSRLTAQALPAAFAAGMDQLAGLRGVNAASGAGSLYAAVPPADRVDLIYAFEWSQRLTLAVGLNRANSDQSLDFGSAGTDSYDADNLGLSLGCDVKDVWFMKLLQAGLQVNEESLDADAGVAGDGKFDVAASGFALRVGADTEGQGASFGRVELGLRTGSLSVQAVSSGAAQGSECGSGGIYNAGYAMGLSQDRGTAFCGLMLNGDFGGDGISGGGAADYNAADLVFSAAGEFKIREWLTARGGLSGSLASAGTFAQSPGPTPAAPAYSASNSALETAGGLAVAPAGSAQAALGLSLDLGDLTVDGSLNQNLLYSGTYLVSGIPEALFGDVSVTWEWE